MNEIAISVVSIDVVFFIFENAHNHSLLKVCNFSMNGKKWTSAMENLKNEIKNTGDVAEM